MINASNLQTLANLSENDCSQSETNCDCWVTGDLCRYPQSKVAVQALRILHDQRQTVAITTFLKLIIFFIAPKWLHWYFSSSVTEPLYRLVKTYVRPTEVVALGF